MPAPADDELKTIPASVARAQSAEDTSDDAGLAAAESSLFATGKSIPELERAARARDHERSENFKDHFEAITVGGLYLMACGVFSFAVAWGWHVLSPENLHWLNGDQLIKIQNIFTGGVLAGMIADQFRRRLG